METSTLFLTRLDDDRGLERSLEPTHLGTRGTHLHSRSVTHLSCADRVPSSIHQHRQSNLSPIAVRGHAIVPLDVYLLLVGLVCAGTRPAAYACACTNNLHSMTLRSLVASLLRRTKFPRIKSPALSSRLISRPPAAPMDFAFRGPRGSQSTASCGEQCVQSPSNRGCQMRPGGSARQLSRARISHCNLPRVLVHQIICIALFSNFSDPALQLRLRFPFGTTTPVLPLSYSATSGGRQD